MSTEIHPGGGDTGATHNLNKRMQLINHLSDVRGRKVIDCGCGHGQYLLAFLDRDGDAYGIEYDSEKVATFQKQYPKYAARIASGNLEQIAFEDNAFDLALLNEVLEHVSNEAAALSEIKRILKPGGLLIVFSPNRFYPFETHGVYWKNSDRKIPHYFPFIPYIPLGLGKLFLRYWARNYWPPQLRRRIAEVGFEIVSTGYVWQTFENISGNQPSWLRPFSTALRLFGQFAERIPIIKIFGVSQYVFAKKSDQ